MTASLHLMYLQNPRWMKTSVLTKRIPVFITYLPYAAARNNTPVTFTKFTELPQYKLSICCMSHCFIFISFFFFLWHCINVVSKIPCNSQYGTIQNNYIDFLKVKICFADTLVIAKETAQVRFSLKLRCLPCMQSICEVQLEKNNINKTGKTKINQPLPGNRH